MSKGKQNNQQSSLLTRLVDSLSLSEGRVDAKGSASVMTLGTMRLAGVTDLDFLPGKQTVEAASKGFEFTENSGCEPILDKLLTLQDRYFVNGLKLKIPVESDSKEATQNEDCLTWSSITTQQRFLNLRNMSAVMYVHNVLKTRSPFVLFDPTSEEIDCGGLYPDIKVRMLKEGPNEHLTPDTLKQHSSWPTALNLNAEPDGDGKHSERTVEHIIGGTLHQLFDLPFCHVVSGRKLNCPDILKLSVSKELDETESGPDAAPAMQKASTRRDNRSEDEQDTPHIPTRKQPPRNAKDKRVKFSVPETSPETKTTTRKAVAKGKKTPASDGTHQPDAPVKAAPKKSKTGGKKETVSESKSTTTVAESKSTKTVAESESPKTVRIVGDCYPDLTAQVLLSQADQALPEAIQELLQPVVIASEAKRRITGDGIEPAEDKKSYRVQLAMAAHPSLVLLILMHLDGKEYDDDMHLGLDLNEDYFIYSIYYDEIKLIVHAQFPCYNYIEDDKSASGWRFIQAKVAELEFPTAELFLKDPVKDAERRVRFAIATQAIREHSKKLSAEFMSPKYRKLVEEIHKDMKKQA